MQQTNKQNNTLWSFSYHVTSDTVLMQQFCWLVAMVSPHQSGDYYQSDLFAHHHDDDDDDHGTDGDDDGGDDGDLVWDGLPK